MERLVAEIFIGLLLLLIGIFLGAGVVCICKNAGEAEKRLKNDDEDYSDFNHEYNQAYDEGYRYCRLQMESEHEMLCEVCAYKLRSEKNNGE